MSSEKKKESVNVSSKKQTNKQTDNQTNMLSKRKEESVNVSSKKQKTFKEDNVEPYTIFGEDESDISNNESDISDTEPAFNYSDVEIDDKIDDKIDEDHQLEKEDLRLL